MHVSHFVAHMHNPKFNSFYPNLYGISRRGSVAAFTGPIGVEELASRSVDSFIGVSAEVIALRLKQVGRKPFAAISVKVAERGGECRRRDSVDDGGGAYSSPTCLRGFDGFLEERIQ